MQTNKYERNVPKIKRYYVLLQQLREQDECVKAFEKRLLDIEATIVQHQNNAERPILTTSIYDPLRNTMARSRRLAEVSFFLLILFECLIGKNSEKLEKKLIFEMKLKILHWINIKFRFDNVIMGNCSKSNFF